ncbi:ATP-binding protein [Flocculibacter collagenilyticus]|uniref:ATP-binding protein n=1 Tax=Flocculibacter collagenilyticus TaxID=2744479 RepID=UPI0018F70271|nr:ATP-binding protein [Flocculibacter collagenilyticus]
MDEQLARLERRLAREKKARKEAEELLESKSLELFKSNNELKTLAQSLEDKVASRTTELVIARDQAVAHARAKTDFLANMSHELRTPMNGVLGMLRILESTSLTEQQQKLIQTATESGKLLLFIINDILDFSKLEEDQLQLEEIPFNPTVLLENTIAPFVTDANTKGVELVSYLSPLLPNQLLGDPTRIQQIITNFLSNAMKFTSTGEVIVKAKMVDSQFVVEVIDSGIGMTQEQVTIIFEKFTQADQSTTRKYGGTGLGLNICEKLVALMNGRIEVDSEIDQGTTFSVLLPLKVVIENAIPQIPILASVNRVVLCINHPVRRAYTIELLNAWQAGIDKKFIELSQVEDIHHYLKSIDNKQELERSLVLVDYIKQDAKYEEEKESLLSSIAKLSKLVVIQCIEHQYDSSTHYFSVSKPIRQGEFQNMLKLLSQENAGKRYRELDEKHKFYGRHVLLVEDNVVNQMVAEALLHDAGFEVTIANNGLEGVQQAQQGIYDLILMDIQMPIKDGLSAAAEIRALGEQYEKLPIFAMTAHATEEDKQKSVSAGMNEHITKPIDPEHLLKTISKYIEQISDQQEKCESASKEEKSSIKTDQHFEYLSGWELDEALKRVNHSTDLLYKILKMFKNQYQNFSIEFNEALKSKQLDEVIRLAHSLKGSAANIGAEWLSHCAAKLEKQVKQNAFTDVSCLHEELAMQLNKAFSDIDLITKHQLNSQYIDKKEKNKRVDANEITSLLTVIQSAIYSDLAVAEESIGTLHRLLSGTEIEEDGQRLDSAFQTFNYTGVEQYIKDISNKLENRNVQ